MRKNHYWPIDDRLAYWHPVLPKRALKALPVSIRVCDVPIVIFVQTSGDIAAIYDRCAHRRAPLSKGAVSENGIVCAYHGCVFAKDGTGYCPTTKSNRFRIPVFQVRVVRDTIWLRSPDAMQQAGIEDQDLGISAALNPDQDGCVFAGLIHKQIAAPLQLVVDNMTELEHTGVVHKNLAFGMADFGTVDTFCEQRGDDLFIYYKGRQRALPFYLKALSGLRNGDFYVQTADVGFLPPHAVYEITWSEGEKGAQRPFGLRFVIYYTPISENETSLFAYIFWNAEGALRRAALGSSAFILKAVVSAELHRDKAIIEKMPQGEMSLDMFQLNKFDRPLVISREIMGRIYTPSPQADVRRQATDTGTAAVKQVAS